MDIENDIQINHDDDENVQMDDDENNDGNSDNINSYEEVDDDMDEISNWTSLNLPAENLSNENSPPRDDFDFDSEFDSAASLFQENNQNDKVNRYVNQLISEASICSFMLK